MICYDLGAEKNYILQKTLEKMLKIVAISYDKR